jgi:8-oxo-dGTP diphosphatase
MRPMIVVAACALVDAEGLVLITQRRAGKPLAGLWEFPGGKVEDGEEPEGALIRELREELGVEIAKEALSPLTFASHAYPDFHLLMSVYVCRRWQGRVEGIEGQKLAWVKPEALRHYDMPPADEPLKIALPDLLGDRKGP